FEAQLRHRGTRARLRGQRGSRRFKPGVGDLEMRRRYRNLPIYAKILVPFAILIVVWGGFGTAILAHGATSEARARATAQLSTAFDGARATLAEDEQNLLQAVRLGANTQGVAAAVVARDKTLLRQLLAPLAINRGHSSFTILDRV